MLKVKSYQNSTKSDFAAPGTFFTAPGTVFAAPGAVFTANGAVFTAPGTVLNADKVHTRFVRVSESP